MGRSEHKVKNRRICCYTRIEYAYQLQRYVSNTVAPFDFGHFGRTFDSVEVSMPRINFWMYVIK